MLHSNRNGFFCALDRGSGEFLRATRLVEKLEWASGIDAGRACPGVRGATHWMSPSFNSATGLLYVVTLEQVRHLHRLLERAGAEEEFLGRGRGAEAIRGGEYPMTGPGESWAGTVSTAGGLVFFRDDDGQLVAVDARDGKHDLLVGAVGAGAAAAPAEDSGGVAATLANRACQCGRPAILAV